MPQCKENRPSIFKPPFAKHLELGFVFYYHDNRMETADGAILLATEWYPRPRAEKRDQKGPTF